ncbi:MFS transporter [bacterium BFN5]|nr:MFS transporter [bacterium BFN5]
MSQKLWNMNFILICFANLAVSIPFHSLLAVLPIYIESLGGSKEMVGLSLGYLTIAAVTIRPLTGWAIDKFGRKGILLLGLLLFALATSGYLAMVPIYILLMLRSLQGLGWGICSTTIGTVASDVIPKTRLGEGLGFFGATASISLALSPALSLSLVDLFPFENLFLICTVFAFVSILLAIAIKSTPTEKPEDMVGTIRFGRSPGGYPYEMYYQFKINALVTDGKANVLAKPKITTINGKEAVINIGGEVPISVTTISDNTTTTSVEYKEAGIILKYTPRINADGYITATVHTEVSSPVYVEALKAYRFNKRSADTEVRLKDGETMVIGGLIGKEEAKNFSKVPFLGDLPILGSLFRNSNNTKNESEVVIFLTAHIVK